jgi:hypothetical protein
MLGTGLAVWLIPVVGVSDVKVKEGNSLGDALGVGGW